MPLLIKIFNLIKQHISFAKYNYINFNILSHKNTTFPVGDTNLVQIRKITLFQSNKNVIKT